MQIILYKESVADIQINFRDDFYCYVDGGF
jgi:hypothetical protein